MKKIPFLLLVLILFAGCKSNHKASEKDSLADSATFKNPSSGLIEKFKPILQGEWVKADYVNKVMKTKSPLAAFDEATGITAMYINTDRIKGDSIVFIAGYGNHEGGDVTIKFRPGKAPSTILFNEDDLSYSIKNGDTTITVAQFDNKTKQITKTKYMRVLKTQPDDNLGYGMYRYINKILVAGNYTLRDSLGATSSIVFSEDGEINGFLNYKTYMINIDLNIGPDDNLDAIYFKTANKENGNYTFKIIADTLKLYSTRESADSTELILDKLQYKLVRQK